MFFMSSKLNKKKVIEQFATHAHDTGSPEVQVALLTGRIKNVVTHLESHPSDHHSRRGLLSMLNQRRRLLKYLISKSSERYKKIIASLGLSK